MTTCARCDLKEELHGKQYLAASVIFGCEGFVPK